MTMSDVHRHEMSRVQRELLELRERGQVSTQKDKYKDCECFDREVVSLEGHNIYEEEYSNPLSWSCAIFSEFMKLIRL